MMNMMVLVTAEVENETVVASNPTSFLVKCFINRAEITKKHGGKNPNKTATYFGMI